MSTAAPVPPLFVFSPGFGRDVSNALTADGFRVVLCPEPREAAQWLAGSAAQVLIADLRTHPDAPGVDGALLRAMGEIMARCRGCMVLLLDEDADISPAALHDMGATHFLRAPFQPVELAAMARLAERVAARSASLPSAEPQAEAGKQLENQTWAWNRLTNQVQISPGLARLLGGGIPSTVIGLEALLRYVDPERKRQVLTAFQNIVESGRPGQVRFSFMGPNTPVRELLHHVYPKLAEDGQVSGLFGTVEVVGDMLGQDSPAGDFDPLTGLPNQDFARAIIEQALAERREGSEPACALIRVSIRRFDQINTAYGHKIADMLLQAVARRLRREAMAGLAARADACASRSIPCRMNGAEFAVIVTGPSVLASSVALAQRIAAAFERPYIVSGRVVHLVSRMGLAEAEADVKDVTDLFQRAGAALGQAKALGPNSYHVFNAGDVTPPALMARLESDLHRALVNDHLDLVFQPQVEIATGRIVGVETLVRWDHPEHGMVTPDVLLTIAENAEIMSQFDDRILRMALSEIATWTDPERAQLRVSVNVSAVQLHDEAFDAQVLNALAHAGVDPSRLTLEVTETAIIESLDVAARMLGRLRSNGVHIAIDDFGTGYSSLAYLKSLPLDYLKVDKKFISDLTRHKRDRIVIHSLVELARSLGIGVVAEGVETEAQLSLLGREGCNWYQGYYCSPPLPALQLKAFVAEWNSKAGPPPVRAERRS
ncbi:putative bifunctional diguanylate cyclase/phosphodiesterase [Pedomonas mirosovicensis]|uniref:putative bifunctional diguanylate cyclase/phosphodiesterase n=1 Tax=Pedomonas mirosovicensis TaxID=2908641 RepID=UPI002169AEC1|nr:EAL domain-containing protein [Pedomonas mirosovicensis]MCH8685214.1 EAL domain-containing protein [Pedomonas mirosovicensis]